MIGSEKISNEFVTTADIRNRSGEYFYAAKKGAREYDNWS